MSTLATGDWLSRERVRRVSAIVGAGTLCLLAWLAISAHGTLDWLGRPLGTDFSQVWAAGRMALHGNAPDAWDWHKHFLVQRAIHGPRLTEVYAWHYPPPFLLIAALLAMLPYLAALILWQLVTLTPFAIMMQRLVPGRDTLLLTLAAPATMLCLTHGQNGFLTALLLAGGLMLLENRPVVAGLLLGCLVYKPQFALVLPVALLAGHHWKAIPGALLSAGFLVGLTFLVWGWPAWQAFFDSLALTRSVIIEQGTTGFQKIVTPFAAARLWGSSVGAAYVVQSVATILALAAVAGASITSRRPALRNALICAAALLSTPYALDYDLVVLLPALAWLYLDGRRNGFLRWDGTLMALIWVAPLFGRAAGQLAYLPLGLLSVVSVMAIAVRRLLKRERDGDRSHSLASKAADRAAKAPC